MPYGTPLACDPAICLAPYSGDLQLQLQRQTHEHTLKQRCCASCPKVSKIRRDRFLATKREITKTHIVGGNEKNTLLEIMGEPAVRSGQRVVENDIVPDGDVDTPMYTRSDTTRTQDGVASS